MEELVEDVPTLAKQGRSVGETEPAALGSPATEAWATTGTETATLTTEGELPTVAADPERLRTLLEHLFQNSVEHAGEDVTCCGGRLDDGRGFDDPQQLFDYGDTTAEGGTGFGSSIVRGVSEAHG